MRYVLNFNTEGTRALGASHGRIVFKKTKGNPFLPGTTTLVRGVHDEAENSVSFFPRRRGTLRFGATLSERLRKLAGVRGSQRYLLKNAGNGWHWLVPESRVTKSSKLKRLTVPAVTVSTID